MAGVKNMIAGLMAVVVGLLVFASFVAILVLACLGVARRSKKQAA